MEWDINNIGNIVDYINLELGKGRTLSDIERSEFGVNPSVISKRLRRLKYKRVNNKFIKHDVGQDVRQFEKYIKLEEGDELLDTGEKTIADIVTINKDEEKLIGLIDNYDIIMELVKAKKNEIGIILELPNEPGKKETRATIRVNKVIWEQFNNFSDKNKQFTKKELVSQAIKEFMEKYDFNGFK
ncbi:MAG: hypothetical protein RSC26_16205 [Terrisporobacter sp.]